MRKRWLVVVVVSVLFAVALVVPAAGAQDLPEITGIQWQWAEIQETVPASLGVVPDPENYVLVLNADGTSNIKADCNMVAWNYTLEDDELTFDTMGPSTLAYCGDDSMDQMYLQKLGMGGAVSMDGDRLVLELNEDAGTMIFNNGGPAEAMAEATVEATAEATEEATAEATAEATEEATAEASPEQMPETGGLPLAAPWAMTMLAGLAALGAGRALKRR